MKERKYGGISKHLDKLIKLFCENIDLVEERFDKTPVKTIRQLHHSIKIASIERIYNEIREVIKQSMLKILLDSFKRYGFGEEILEKYKRKTLYLKSIPTYLLLYFAWLKINEFNLKPEDIDRLFESGVIGTLGYRLLDLHFDTGVASDYEAIIGLALIQQHEEKLLKTFGYNKTNIELIHQCKNDYFDIEIREKSLRGKHSTFVFEKPIECAYKAAPVFSAFALALAHAGRIKDIQIFKRVCYLIAANVQIMDDLTDLEEDLAQGLFTLPTYGLESKLINLTPKDGARLINSDKRRIKQLYDACCNLLKEASELAGKVDDPLFKLAAEIRLARVHKIFLEKEDDIK